MGVLENISSPEDVKRLTAGEVDALCMELREFLIDKVSTTGGHLASNLGIVELTVALHRVYDTSADRLVFDVGHQCYAHKILTGRRDGFDRLRMQGGISGFPKPSESEHDAFIAGHASNSVSVALGMARARSAQGDSYKVVSIIGDGALTGGLAYEGLSCAGASGEPMVVILNDNGMSINRGVGGTEKLLSHLRVRPGYLNFKKSYRAVIGRIKPLYSLTHRLKEWLKGKLISGNMFADMGFNYLGPVDGHDVRRLEQLLRWTRELNEPVLLHVLTQKGRGYPLAEESPDAYHGVGSFDPDTGVQSACEDGYSAVFGSELCRLAAEDKRIAAITAAMSDGTGLVQFAEKFPDRFYDVGITEGGAVSMAAGMAKQGALPVFAVYSSFLQRGFDMLIHDVSLLKLHVVLAVDRAGLVGPDGETHHGSFDVSYLCTVPYMAVLCPASHAELRSMLGMALYTLNCPVAIRYPRGGEGEYAADNSQKPAVILREGTDVTLVVYGQMTNEAVRAALKLSALGVSAEIVKLNLINPLEEETVLDSLKKTKRLVVSEDVCAHGCVGQRILALCASRGVPLSGARLLNLGSGVAGHGSADELLASLGLDAAGIVKAALEIIEHEEKA